MDIIMDFVKKWQKLLILCGVMLVVFLVGNGIAKSQKKILTSVNNEVAQLKSQQLVKKNTPDEGGLAASDGTEIDMMVNSERIDADKVILEEFAKKAFTFSNVDEYQDVRKDLLSVYRSASESDFFRYFYTTVAEEETGSSRYDYVISKNGVYSATYKDMSSYVVYMRGNEYTYVNHVIITGDKGDHELVFVCSVDAEGNIGNLQGYSLK